MVDINIVNIRISKLYEYLGNLEKLKHYSFEEFQSDFMIYSAAERQLQLALECVQDIATHVIADGRLGVPASNEDIYMILYKARIIPKELSEKLANMAKVRNILVHGYIALNRKIVYDAFYNHLEDVISFVKCVLKYIE